MVSAAVLKKIALSFDAAEELPHFEKSSFRVAKKIFATLDIKNQRATLKLTAVDQSVFSAYDPQAIYPVPNSWGKQGWTIFELKKLRKDLFTDALTQAYCAVAPPKLAAKYRRD